MATKVQEDPTRLSPLQWIARGLRLPLREMSRRIGRLLVGLPLSVFQLRRLRRLARGGNRRLHVIILTDRLGDIIAAEPAVRALREEGDYLVWLVRDRFVDALNFAEVVDAVVAVSSLTEALLLRRLFGHTRFSLVQKDLSLCNMFGFVCHNPNTAGINNHNYYEEQRTLCDVFALTATGQPATSKPRIWPDPHFDVRDFLRQIFADANRPLIVVHAMSDEAARSWQTNHANELADYLLAQTEGNLLELGLTPVLTEGPRVQSLGARLGLARQFALIGHANLFIGVDSGFSHAANAAGVPCVFLLGAYHDFGDYLPWRLQACDRVVRTPGQVATLDAHAVMAAALAALADSREAAASSG